MLPVYPILNGSEPNMIPFGYPSPITDSTTQSLPNLSQLAPTLGGNLEVFSRDYRHPTAWIQEFGKTAPANNWTEDQKGVQFATDISGSAKNRFDANNAQQMTSAFNNNISADSIHHYSLLYNRRQIPGESIDSYGYDIKQLIRRVNPNMAEGDKLNYFIRGLLPQFQEFVIKKRPNTFNSAFASAKNKESLDRNLSHYSAMNSIHSGGMVPLNTLPGNFLPNTSVTSFMPIMPTLTTSVTPTIPTVSPTEFNDLKSEIKELRKTIQERTKRTRDEEPRRPYKLNKISQEGSGIRPICRHCKKVGHMEKSCWELQNGDERTTFAKKSSEIPSKDYVGEWLIERKNFRTDLICPVCAFQAQTKKGLKYHQRLNH